MEILIFTKHSGPVIEFFKTFLPSDSRRHARRGVYDWKYGVIHCAIYEVKSLRDNFKGMKADMIYADEEFLTNSGIYEHLIPMARSTSTIFPTARLWEHDHYDYHEEILHSVKEYLSSRYYQGKENRDYLYWDIFLSPVTGNRSFEGYTSDTIALQYLSSNLPLSLDTYKALNGSFKVEITPKVLDVAIRCYLLRDCLDEIFDEYMI